MARVVDDEGDESQGKVKNIPLGLLYCCIELS